MQVFAFGFPTFSLPFVYSGAIEEFGWTTQEAVLITSFKFYVSAIVALIIAGTVLLKHRYGIQNLGINMGIFLFATTIGFGFCPPFMANKADQSESYSGAFALGTIAVFVSAILLFPVRTRSIHTVSKK